jgi:hypothetical protein
VGIASEFNGRQMLSTLTIAKSADGTLTGKWGSTDLSNVKFDGQSSPSSARRSSATRSSP